MRTQWLAAVLLIAPWACGLGAEPGEGEVANAIVAIVNNEPITKLEADVLVREFYRDAEKVTPEDYRATWEKAREALVEHRLLIQEARRRKVEVPPEEVNAEVQRLERAGPGPGAGLDFAAAQGHQVAGQHAERKHRQGQLWHGQHSAIIEDQADHRFNSASSRAP